MDAGLPSRDFSAGGGGVAAGGGGGGSLGTSMFVDMIIAARAPKDFRLFFCVSISSDSLASLGTVEIRNHM